MTNAIEQTRREMHAAFANMQGRIAINYSIKDMQRGADEFKHALEAHLEELRKDSMDTLGRLAAMTEERDTLRNKLQALQMASSTAAEVIRGLRSELEEARECKAQDSDPEASNAGNASPYHEGFDSAGKRGCPYPLNTIERLHWMDGARDRIGMVNQIYGVRK